MRVTGRADCHAHIIAPERFPFADGPGYMPRADEVGLLHRPDGLCPRRGTRLAGPAAPGPLTPRTAMRLQEPLQGPEAREPTQAPLLQLPADGLRPAPRKGCAPCPVGHQLRANPQDQGDQAGRGPAPNPARRPGVIAEARAPRAPIPCRPLGHPGATSSHGSRHGGKRVSVSEQVNRFATSRVLTEISHCVSSPYQVSGSLRRIRLVYDLMAEFRSTMLWR